TSSATSMMHASIYRLRSQDILTICALGLLCLGVIMVQSAAMTISEQTRWHWNERGTKHLIFVGIAIVTFFIVGQLDYGFLGRQRGLRSPVLWMLGAAVLACMAVLIPHVGMAGKCAPRRLAPRVSQVQPSELGKWGVVLFVAWWLANKPMETSQLPGFVVTLIPVAAICLLVVIEDFGTAALIGLCAITMCLAGRVRLWHLGLVVPL